MPKKKTSTPCPGCGGTRWCRDNSPTLIHEPQWDAEGQPTCAHSYQMLDWCARCGWGRERAKYLGLHRYCPERERGQ
jgi:hypothetical protein